MHPKRMDAFHGVRPKQKKGEKKMKECMICGNKKAKELEQTTLFSDGEGNETEELDWICKENKGCNNQ